MNKSDTKEDTEFRVLRVLQDQPDMTQREIATHLGISLGGVNYCLRALANKGLLKIKNFRNSSNKVGYVYLLTPKGIAEKTALTSRFLKRKLEEYEALKVEIESLKEEIKDMPDSQPLGEEPQS
jgi:EPS-associated MarR family transcriptional regulator